MSIRGAKSRSGFPHEVRGAGASRFACHRVRGTPAVRQFSHCGASDSSTASLRAALARGFDFLEQSGRPLSHQRAHHVALAFFDAHVHRKSLRAKRLRLFLHGPTPFGVKLAHVEIDAHPGERAHPLGREIRKKARKPRHRPEILWIRRGDEKRAAPSIGHPSDVEFAVADLVFGEKLVEKRGKDFCAVLKEQMPVRSSGNHHEVPALRRLPGPVLDKGSHYHAHILRTGREGEHRGIRLRRIIVRGKDHFVMHGHSGDRGGPVDDFGYRHLGSECGGDAPCEKTQVHWDIVRSSSDGVSWSQCAPSASRIRLRLRSSSSSCCARRLRHIFPPPTRPAGRSLKTPPKSTMSSNSLPPPRHWFKTTFPPSSITRIW